MTASSAAISQNVWSRTVKRVLVADIAKSDLPHYARARFVHCDVTNADDVIKVEIGPDDMVYNMAAKMLSPLQVRSKRWQFFWPVNYYGAENIMKATAKSGANRMVQFTTDMIYGHTIMSPQTEAHPAKPLGEYGKSKWATEQLAAEWRKQGMNISIFPPAPHYRPRPSRHSGKAVQADRRQSAGADDRLGQEPPTSSSRFSIAPRLRVLPGRAACRTRLTISAPTIRRR